MISIFMLAAKLQLMALYVSFKDEHWMSQSNNFTLENSILNLMMATPVSSFENHPSVSFNNQPDHLLADKAG